MWRGTIMDYDWQGGASQRDLRGDYTAEVVLVLDNASLLIF